MQNIKEILGVQKIKENTEPRDYDTLNFSSVQRLINRTRNKISLSKIMTSYYKWYPENIDEISLTSSKLNKK